MPVDYSKWDHIEISDDEDDTHPNIDTPSLFKWRHEARVQRMAEAQKEKEDLAKGKEELQQKMTQIKQKLKDAPQLPDGESKSTEAALKELQLQEEEYKKKEEELKKKEKLTPLNIDTICHDGKGKTIINKTAPRKKEELTEEEKMERQKTFTAANEPLLKKFGLFKKYDDSQEFLSEHPQLVCEETANYLVLWCIDLEMEGKKDLMAHVAHQTIVMQFILELSRNLDRDPRSCVRPFFSRIKLAEKQYMDAFNDELSAFKERVRSRAEARLEKAMKEAEEEEREKRLGPGGLDPVEVFESLPEVMKDCFEKKDIPLLQKVIGEMDPKDAEYHMKRCVASGLWVPGGGSGAEGEEGAVEPDTGFLQEQATGGSDVIDKDASRSEQATDDGAGSAV